jgi:hypothetical protein
VLICYLGRFCIMAGLKNGFGVYVCTQESVFFDVYGDGEEDIESTVTTGYALMLPFCQITIQWERE